MTRRLPPFGPLVAFDAVARHRSFTRAADELGVTQSAVSHRVRRLEDFLGVQLVKRLNPGIALSDDGAKLHGELAVLLDGMAGLEPSLRRRVGRQTLRLGAGSSLAAWWLVRRLRTFRALHAEIEIDFVPVESEAAGGPPLDLRILWTTQAESRATTLQAPLFRERVFPVCAPSLLPRGRPLTDPAALLDLPLIQKTDTPSDEWSWATWFRKLGLNRAEPRGLVLGDMGLCLTAAVEGAGVAISRSLLVADAISDGRLVPALADAAALAAASAAGGFSCVEFAKAAPIEVPTVDKLAIRVLVDSSYDLFFRPAEVNGVKIAPPPRAADFRRTLHNEWGLSLWLESERGADKRTVMLDYGYSPAVLLNNIELTGVDPSKIDALVVSHGHYDHFGGLQGFLDKYRGVLPADVKLYAGGEDNFCHRLNGNPQQGFVDFGTLDRRELAAKKVATVLCENPTVIVGHAFTTGKIDRNSIERVLPNTSVERGIKDGLGCNTSHYLPAELDGKIVPDEHTHEHATCFNIKDKGLVVISSCGHVGIVNSVRQAQKVSGVQKVHAIVGGFHLGPAPADYLTQVVAEIKKLEPDALIPMHCSGLNFVAEARKQMPGNVLVTTTGSRMTFGA